MVRERGLTRLPTQGVRGTTVRYPAPVRRLPWLICGLLLTTLLVGSVPRRSEVQRAASLPAAPDVVHALLATLPEGPAWCTWEPALRPAGDTALVPTASDETRGLWFDVPGPSLRKAALLLEPEGDGTRVEWFDVLHLSGNPIASIQALTRQHHVGGQLEQSLASLREVLERRR